MGLFDFLLLKILPFELFSLFLGQLDFLDFRGFPRTNSLELDSGAFIAELGHKVPQVQLNAMLLGNVVESQLNHDLPECGVFFGLFNGDGGPNHIDDLGRVPFFVGLLTDIT